MTPQQFQAQMGRMIETFGKDAYGTERCKLIWREVKDFSPGWWERTVDYFIGESHKAPLLPQIREQAAIERERQYQYEKEKNRREAEAAYEASIRSSATPDNEKRVRDFLAMIRTSLERAGQS